MVAPQQAARPTEEDTLAAMSYNYRMMNRREHIAPMFEAAVQAKPGDPAVLKELFMAYVKVRVKFPATILVETCRAFDFLVSTQSFRRFCDLHECCESCSFLYKPYGLADFLELRRFFPCFCRLFKMYSPFWYTI